MNDEQSNVPDRNHHHHVYGPSYDGDGTVITVDDLDATDVNQIELSKR